MLSDTSFHLWRKNTWRVLLHNLPLHSQSLPSVFSIKRGFYITFGELAPVIRACGFDGQVCPFSAPERRPNWFRPSSQPKRWAWQKHSLWESWRESALFSHWWGGNPILFPPGPRLGRREVWSSWGRPACMQGRSSWRRQHRATVTAPHGAPDAPEPLTL